MTTEIVPASAPTKTKYAVGKNPNSLKNLRMFRPGESGNPAGNPSSGPVIAPALRRYGQMSLAELKALDLERLPALHALAVVALLKGIDPKYGDKMRELVTRRIDGDDLGPQIAIALQVNLRWSDDN